MCIRDSNGTAWGLDKYNQWTGVNDFNNLIGLNGAELWFKNQHIDDFTTNPAEHGSQSVLQIWNKNTTQYSGGLIDYQMTDGSHILEITCFGYPLNDPTPYQHRFKFAAYRDGVADFYPALTNSVNLGTSYNKWKTLNGINPGALSLPTSDSTKWVDLSGNLTAASSANTYTPAVDGWISVMLKKTGDATAVFLMQGNIKASCFSNTALVGESAFAASACIPVRAGISVDIHLKGSGSTIDSAYFIPCQGNV